MSKKLVINIDGAGRLDSEAMCHEALLAVISSVAKVIGALPGGEGAREVLRAALEAYSDGRRPPMLEALTSAAWIVNNALTTLKHKITRNNRLISCENNCQNCDHVDDCVDNFFDKLVARHNDVDKLLDIPKNAPNDSTINKDFRVKAGFIEKTIYNYVKKHHENMPKAILMQAVRCDNQCAGCVYRAICVTRGVNEKGAK